MKKFILLLISACIIFSSAAQKNKKAKTIEPITTSDLPVLSSETVEPIKSTDYDGELKTPKWKDYWKFSGIAGIKISQTQLVNWAAGGNSNFMGIAYANLVLNYKKKKIAWDTKLDTDFGALFSSDYESYRWRKGNDKINFSSSFGYEISPAKNIKSMWFIAVLGSFKSQYLPGYNYPKINERNTISDWLSPSYTELSIGINWKWTDIFSVYYSPVAGLLTSCTDPLLRPAFGVPADKVMLNSLGMTFRAGISYAKVKNLKILTNVQLYTPYTDKEQKFGNFNLDWDFTVSYQFLKVLNVSLQTNLKYYPKVEFNDPGKPKRRVQFQEVFGLGLAYSF